MRKLVHPIHSVSLKHHKYRGRIAWDATDPKDIAFCIHLTSKGKPEHSKVVMPVVGNSGIQMMDIGESSQIVVVTLNFFRNHEEFDNNYYHPDFPKEVQKHVSTLLKEDKVVKRQLEKVLKT